MTNISQKIVFFGTEDFSAASLKALISAGYEIAAVVTKPDSKKGRGQKIAASTVKMVAESHHIPVWQPEELSAIVNDVKTLQPVASVLVSFGKIIPGEIIDLFSSGIINVHPSLLPRYRGPSPIESAIENGDEKTGVTIMRLDVKMDAGPLYVQETLMLTGTETQPMLHDTLSGLGAELLVKSLPDILSGTLTPSPQDESQASYCPLLEKADAVLRPSELTAAEAERKVRAHQSFPKTKFELFGHQIIITKCHVTEQQKTPLDVLCRDGEFVSIDELVAPSGRHMTAESFLNGYGV